MSVRTKTAAQLKADLEYHERVMRVPTATLMTYNASDDAAREIRAELKRRESNDLTAAEYTALRKMRAAERHQVYPGNVTDATLAVLEARELIFRRTGAVRDGHAWLLTDAGHAAIETALRGRYAAENRRADRHWLKHAAEIVRRLDPGADHVQSYLIGLAEGLDR